MEKKGVATFLIDPKIVEKALGLPDGYSIIGSVWDFTSGSMRLYVESQDFPEVVPGGSPLSVSPTLSHHEDPKTGKPVIIWDFGMGG